MGFERSSEKIPMIDLASITYLPETRSKSDSYFVTVLTNDLTASIEFKLILTVFIFRSPFFKETVSFVPFCAIV